MSLHSGVDSGLGRREQYLRLRVLDVAFSVQGREPQLASCQQEIGSPKP